MKLLGSTFYKDLSRKSGVSTYCKECRKKKSNKRYEAKSDEIKHRQKNIYANLPENEKGERRKANNRRNKARREANIDFYLLKEAFWRKNNPENKKANQRRYREKHLLKIRTQARVYNKSEKGKERKALFLESNPGYTVNYKRQYYEENKDEILEQQREYYAKHTDLKKAINKNWRDKNPDKVRAAKAAYKAKIKGGFAKLDNKEKAIVMDMYRLARELNMQVDHIIPIQKGGIHHPGNLQIISRDLNLKKHARIGRYTHNEQGIVCIPFCSKLPYKLVKENTIIVPK